MSLLEHGTRVYLDETGEDKSDWVEVRQLSIGELRDFRQRVRQVEPGPGEDPEEAQGYELSRLVLESCVFAWSEDAPVTPTNVARLPYMLTFRLTTAAGLGGAEAEPPLPTGSISSDSSAGSQEPENPMST